MIAVGKEIAAAGRLRWVPTPRWAAAVGGIALVALVQIYRLEDLTEFIYFNF